MAYLVASLVHFTLQPGSVDLHVNQDFATVGPAAAAPEPASLETTRLSVRAGGFYLFCILFTTPA
jgi:hypothetical protein